MFGHLTSSSPPVDALISFLIECKGWDIYYFCSSLAVGVGCIVISLVILTQRHGLKVSTSLNSGSIRSACTISPYSWQYRIAGNYHREKFCGLLAFAVPMDAMPPYFVLWIATKPWNSQKIFPLKVFRYMHNTVKSLSVHNCLLFLFPSLPFSLPPSLPFSLPSSLPPSLPSPAPLGPLISRWSQGH